MGKGRDYEAIARASYEAATNPKFPMALRQYYARLAEWADAKARKLLG